MAAALFGVGRIRGIDRPALASIFPASKTPAILIDLVANTDPTPQNLMQFAMMGSIYAERALGVSKPRVAIVSNGEEAEKGSERVKAVFPLLQASGLNFIGNVEGKDIPKGLVDVIVTDGFTGNVIIKLTEGLVSFLARTVKDSLTGGVLNKIGLVLMIPGLILMLPGMLFLLPAVQRLRKRVDYRELGAAPLLGVDGVVLIAHGRSDAAAIRGAIRSTIRAAEGALWRPSSAISARPGRQRNGSPSAQA
jgi:glycerol-3-phosphate acyltransferase PlsX